MAWKSVTSYDKKYTKDTVLDMGKYKGQNQTISQIMTYDAQWLLWMNDNKYINIKDQELLNEITDLMYEQASYDDDPYEGAWYNEGDWNDPDVPD